jgi:hypothetical protein
MLDEKDRFLADEGMDLARTDEDKRSLRAIENLFGQIHEF